ncbi:MAG: hypothetical protein K0S61_4595 [Anaerocolumna sp.]|nr:hypothetical protein [Anaerocolumna sp.]
MNNNFIQQITQGLQTAFINQNITSNLAYKPQFISNNYKEGRKVLSSIEDELLRCDQFFISVAFINMNGVAPLLQTLKELENKGVPGKILTTNYLNFSEPKALRKLAELTNIELKMYCTEGSSEGFHTKGYIFKEDEIYKIIVGSSNITSGALTKNKEWNTKIISAHEGEYANEIMKEFNEFWRSEYSRSFNDFIAQYEVNYELVKRQKALAKKEDVPSFEQYLLKPNAMQSAFVANLRKLRIDGEQKALLISSTGTGKTYASAFAVNDINPKKTLFLVHREQILKQAVKSYKRVFGSSMKMEILSGNEKDYSKLKEADVVFAMMTMMAKEEVRSKFLENEFEVIVVDEVHRAASKSYQRIMSYFLPDFWLGMTASPDRPDGEDIYKIFDNNIAYEIRLQQALEEELLCPFHYFGITDIEVDGLGVNDDLDKLKQFILLASDQRVDYIIDKIDYFGYSGDRVKGLVFCSSLREAVLLSEKFNHRGYKTCALSGNDSTGLREQAIKKLIEDDKEDYLDYIFTVDIFNEGVDIPEVNQVVMLRPTESSIIFIQQLGRGLRKCEGKEYVVILDFIGNYTNNYLIPIALSGDRSRNKDALRRYVAEGTRIIPGSSSIHFDEIAKDKIYRSIDSSTINKVNDIVYEYRCLRNKLGRIPSYEDFENYNTIDMTCIFNNSSLGSYHVFLSKYEKEYLYKNSLTDDEEEMIIFVSHKIANGKRADELLLIKRLLRYETGILNSLKTDLNEVYGIEVDTRRVKNVVNVLTNNFLPSKNQKKKFSRSIFVHEVSNDLFASRQLVKAKSNEVFNKLMNELLDYGILRYEKYYMERYKNTDFVLYQKYTKSDICRLLKWSKNQNPQNIGGYFYDRETKTLPVFINYKKDEDVVESQNYEDKFLSPSRLISISKSGRNLSSPEMDYFYSSDTSIFLFMQKSSNDKGASEYYFLGQIFNTGEKELVKRAGIGDTVLKFHYNLDIPVREDLYQYFTYDYIPVD